MTGDNTLIHSHGINRRDFMKLCAALAATMGLSSKAAAEMAESVTNPQRPPVIWIGAQECTGCTESLLRATHPTVETSCWRLSLWVSRKCFPPPSGHQVEENKHNALEKYKGQYVLVVDGSIPLKDNGIYCMVAGEPIVDHIRKAAEERSSDYRYRFLLCVGAVLPQLELTLNWRSQPARSSARQNRYQYSGLPAEPAQLPRDRCAHHHLRQTAETG